MYDRRKGFSHSCDTQLRIPDEEASRSRLVWPIPCESCRSQAGAVHWLLIVFLETKIRLAVLLQSFNSTIRLDVRRSEQIKTPGKDKNVIGNVTKIKVVKNKVAPPFKLAQVELMYGQGISRVSEVIDLGVETDVIQKSGAWYDYNGELKAQGKEPMKKVLLDNPVLLQSFKSTIK